MTESYVYTEAKNRGRKMAIETRTLKDGEEAVLVPRVLLPIENTILETINGLPSEEDSTAEIHGYGIALILDPDNKSKNLREGFLYKALQRLERWGYLSTRLDLDPESNRPVFRRMYSITDAGKNRINGDAQPQK